MKAFLLLIGLGISTGASAGSLPACQLFCVHQFPGGGQPLASCMAACEDEERSGCPSGSANGCGRLPFDSPCVDFQGNAGKCRPTPLTAGGFCLCHP